MAILMLQFVDTPSLGKFSKDAQIVKCSGGFTHIRLE